jgi:hypothetical protein
MAKKDEKPSEEVKDKVVEGETPAEPESEEQPEAPQTDTEAEEETPEAPEPEKEEGETQAEFQRRVDRFKGETLEDYTRNLEDGYLNSYEQFKKVRDERDTWKAKAMKEIADDTGEEKPEEPKPQVDPLLDYARQDVNDRMRQEYLEFAGNHAVVDETSDEFDEDVFKEFDAEVGYARDFLYRKTGRIPSMKESMERAWSLMRPEEVSKEEKVAMTAKDAGASTKNKGVSKDAPKPKYSDKQIDTAKKFDPELRDKTRTEIEEILDKYKSS